GRAGMFEESRNVRGEQECLRRAGMFEESNNPLLVRRGGCAIKKMSRSIRSGADGVVAHTEALLVSDHPALAVLTFLDSLGHPSSRGGEYCSPQTFLLSSTHTCSPQP